MLKKYCYENSKNWGQGVELVQFALRDTVQESLGFTPFEMVFGHNIRKPITVTKDMFLEKADEKINVLQYVQNFREKLHSIRELAHDNLANTKSKMKTWYDKKAVKRSFKSGDKVLMLVPVTGKPFDVKYLGPYTVVEKINELNYLIRTPDRRKSKQMCHINMLKQYYERENVSVKPVLSYELESFDHDRDSDHVPLIDESSTGEDINKVKEPKLIKEKSKQKNSEVLDDLEGQLGHLEVEQRHKLIALLREFSDV